jgi:hypothetical protein
MKKSILLFCTLIFIGGAAFAASCKNYTTCEQAVIAWCKGEHPRADGDNDGIPCENVCKSKEQVERIKAKINCSK